MKRVAAADLGREILIELRLRGRNKAWLVRKTGLSRQTVDDAVAGRRDNLRSTTIKAIADALGWGFVPASLEVEIPFRDGEREAALDVDTGLAEVADNRIDYWSVGEDLLFAARELALARDGAGQRRLLIAERCLRHAIRYFAMVSGIDRTSINADIKSVRSLIAADPKWKDFEAAIGADLASETALNDADVAGVLGAFGVDGPAARPSPGQGLPASIEIEGDQFTPRRQQAEQKPRNTRQLVLRGRQKLRHQEQTKPE